MPETWINSVYHPPRTERPWNLEKLLDCRVHYYSLGRWALVDALKACGVGIGDKVLMPAFICRDLLASLHEVGAVPIFYPISEKMELAGEPAALPFARAIIAVNYFGFPQNMEPFREYCRRTRACLIEDNAHGLLSRAEDGRWLGTRGDLGIFSLRKTLALPNGAALVINPGSFLALREPPPFRRAGGLRWCLKQRVRGVVDCVGSYRYFKFLESLRSLRKRVFGQEPFSNGKTETEIPLPMGPCMELSKLITVADIQVEIERRRSLYQLCEEALEGSGVRAVFSELHAGTAPYGYPFFAESTEIPQIRKRLAGHGLGCLPWPDLPSAIEPEAPRHYRNIWMVHFLW